MSLLRWLRRLLGRTSSNRTEDEGAFRCVRCGTEFERQHHTCPVCGAQFVAEIGDE